MLNAFTRNYEDNSTEAGHQFTFYCDVCNNGWRSGFIESETYRKNQFFQGLGSAASTLGGLFGGRLSNIGYSADRATDIISERFENRSPEWQKEHEQAFIQARNEALPHFHRCPSCNQFVCDHCWNEDEGLCTECAPRQEIYVAKARAEAMKRNIDEASQTATVWKGEIESKTTICPVCGKPAGSGKFCNNCGASMALKVCPNCGSKNSHNVKFCGECGSPLNAQPVRPQGLCPSCGTQNAPGTRFCGECGTKL